MENKYYDQPIKCDGCKKAILWELKKDINEILKSDDVILYYISILYDKFKSVDDDVDDEKLHNPEYYMVILKTTVNEFDFRLPGRYYNLYNGEKKIDNYSINFSGETVEKIKIEIKKIIKYLNKDLYDDTEIGKFLKQKQQNEINKCLDIGNLIRMMSARMEILCPSSPEFIEELYNEGYFNE